ncbi:receptor-type tyrosine-protein phosphatase C isoform X2 [Halichoeres trimaculatus]|uniref:receptor-type tyrosine-protein phosphatase C isoform X2 n=1 Tax=Halichoeres trimaculatus TaxID=147232 RepID=UPI003D9F2A98
MAGLFGLKILLLWAGFISLADCDGSSHSTTSPPLNSTNSAPPSVNNLDNNSSSPRIMATSPVMTSVTPRTPFNQTTKPATPPANTLPTPTISKTNDPQTNISQPSTKSNTTVVPEADKNATSKPTQVKCSYSVSTIQFGLQIDLTNSSNGDYFVTFTEEGKTGIKKKDIVHSDQNPLHLIKHLKPCTEYKHAVVFIDSAGKEIPCNHTGNKTIETFGMKKDDVTEGSCMLKHVCYKSEWDISSSISASNNVSAKQCKNGSTMFCIKPGINDICTNLTTTFTSGKCSKAPPFSLTKAIPFDFLDVGDINKEFQTGFPVEVKPNLPQNCKILPPVYSCRENGKRSEPRNLSMLEPFTNYSCTGEIKQNNVTHTVDFKVNVTCDVTTKINDPKSSSTSIHLSWTTTSQRCKAVPTIDRKFGYNCSCVPPPKHVSGPTHTDKTTCDIHNLEPYTDYRCTVQPLYDGRKVGSPESVNKKTDIGTPGDIPSLSVSVKDHNNIKVTCDPPQKFNGPDKKFVARLYPDGSQERKEEIKPKCDFEFKDLSYSTKYILEVAARNEKFEGKVVKKEVNTQYNDKAVIGFLIFLIVLTSVALLLVVYKIFILKRRQSHDMSEHIKLIPSNEENLLTVEPIAADVLLDAYKSKLADEGRLFLAEFQSIPRIFSRYSVKEAKKQCNAPKNRYVDILPYDHNRVQLSTGNGEPGCDYINASFIDGYKESKKYIAAQGPKEETVCDFWRMVWEQQSSIIVMVTRCEEGNRVKCAQYWPSPARDTEIFEEFIVKLNSEDNCPDYTIRRLSLTNKREKNSEREVTHIQFISWPDHGVPGEPHLLLKLRRRVNAFKNFFSGPIVVHCSAGVGRTGTYIGIDAMMEGLEAEGRVDIYGYVVQLRRQRCLMVQVEAQYILIHQALLEHNQFGETEISLSELHSTLNTLKQKSSDSEPSLMEEEFERLPSFKNWRTFNAGITEENKEKNRSSSVIPYDYNRVLLSLDEGRSHDSEPDEDEEDESSDEEDEDSSKYINASHIDGYWGQRIFIAAQTPLPDTISDFWSMVHQKKVSTIVMLSDGSEGEKDGVYWDKDKKIFGDFEVEVASTDITPTFTTRNMLLRHVKRKESRPVKHFQFLKWESKELPEKAQYLTDMIKDIKQSCGGGKSQRNNPILVHCNDGSSRSGVFCALWNVLDSAETEKLVDVFQVAKTLRKERQGMLTSLEQYQFLYDALEGVFPVQNGDVKAAQSSAADSVQIVNETKAAAATAAEQPAEKPEQTASTTSNSQQGAAESAPPVADGGKEEKKEEATKVPTETTPLEDTSNGPTVTVEV